MKTTIKVALSLFAAVLLVAWVSAHDNDNDNDHDGNGGRGGLRGLLENITGGGIDPIWDIFNGGRPATWVPFASNPRFARYPASAAANQQAVLDRSTGLVWQRVPSTGTAAWEQANDSCATLQLANVLGWRLPGLQELETLADPANHNPALPTGHPFTIAFGSPALYWSATTSENNAPLFAFGVTFDSVFVAADQKTIAHRFWCVRGGSGLPIQ